MTPTATLHRATLADKSTLRNLMELYLYDFSEFTGSDVDESGLYGYEYLDFYWTDPAWHPFLVRVNGRLAGFVLVRDQGLDNGELVHHIAEFFILRKYRRQHIGKQAAFQVFDRFPGLWRVTEIEENKAAQAFWRQVIGEYCGGNFREVQDGDWEGPIQEFTAPPGQAGR
jgi:predicted acetyltransferase